MRDGTVYQVGYYVHQSTYALHFPMMTVYIFAGLSPYNWWQTKL